MKQLFYFIYLWLIAVPIFLVLTVLTSLSVAIGSLLGSKQTFSYYPGKIWSWLTCYLMLCPVTVKGRENVQKGRSCIYVANHQGAFDIFMIYGFLGAPFKWMMKAGIGKIPFVGFACKSAGFIFVDNSTPKRAAKSIFEAEKCMKEGSSLVIFPEGSRSYDGKMIRFKKGAFQIAVDRKVDIVPITINGSYDVLRIGSLNVHPHRLEMVIHPVIKIPDNVESNHKELQRTADEVQAVIESALWDKYK